MLTGIRSTSEEESPAGSIEIRLFHSRTFSIRELLKRSWSALPRAAGAQAQKIHITKSQLGQAIPSQLISKILDY